MDRAQSIEFLSGAFGHLSKETISKALDNVGGDVEQAMDALFSVQEEPQANA